MFTCLSSIHLVNQHVHLSRPNEGNRKRTLHKTDLSDSSTWRPLFRIQVDLLECHDF